MNELVNFILHNAIATSEPSAGYEDGKNVSYIYVLMYYVCRHLLKFIRSEITQHSILHEMLMRR